ncbi:tetratricopeptide repeat protein [Porphyromonas macacae]|uniref:Predicted O-linked N-acetylglucosamine transferase, SPINDLY family n=1 Tax=Porphyromonas macacae TaxID=28115 RepID=A0A379DKX3_9PORP|nr:tetratricopeptide repeat protein [Porphyromonas macacae]SUB78604.1 Predicted O-linked N-acetylglucosamine transferase, SPINDLY family [Porphyromonas macacae]
MRKKNINKPGVLLLIIILGTHFSWAQGIKTDIRKGNKLFKKEVFTDSEISYRKALQRDSTSTHALFGLSDALYKQGKEQEAVNYLESLSNVQNLTNEERAHVFHNIGNAFMKQKDFAKSVEAYKMSLRLNPNDDETRYNLVLAQKQLQQNKQNQGGGGNNNENDQSDKDKNKDKNQEQQNQDQKDQNKENPQQPQNRDENKSDQPQKNQESEMTPQQAEQILEAYKQDENKTRQKVEREKQKKQRAASAKIKKKW